MARPLRIEFEGAWYLIHNQGAEGINIFNDDGDRKEFLKLLGEVTQLFSVEVHSYCLLDDEIFLVLHTPKGQLSRAMRHLNGVYTQHHNSIWEHDGAVFKGRYKSILFDPEENLLNIVTYLHHLPVMAGDVRRAEDFKWSSHSSYLNSRSKPEWLNSARTLSFVGGFLKALSFAKFARLVQKGPSLEFMSLIEHAGQIMGSEEFYDYVNNHESDSKKEKSKEGRQHQSTAKEILDFVAGHYGMDVKSIKSSQAGVQNEARNMAVYQLRQAAGLPQKEIAKVLNSKNAYTVAKVLQRFNEKIEQDEQLHQEAQALTKTIQSKLMRVE